MRPTTAVSKFKIYEESTRDLNWANYTDENILLYTHYKAKGYTDLTGPIMDYISTAAPGLHDKKTPLQDWLKGSNRVRSVDSDYVRWRLKGTNNIRALSIENLHPGIP